MRAGLWFICAVIPGRPYASIGTGLLVSTLVATSLLCFDRCTPPSERTLTATPTLLDHFISASKTGVRAGEAGSLRGLEIHVSSNPQKADATSFAGRSSHFVTDAARAHC